MKIKMLQLGMVLAVLAAVLAGPARADGTARISVRGVPLDIQRIYLSDHVDTVDLHVLTKQGEFVLAGIPHKRNTLDSSYPLGPEERHEPNVMVHAYVQLSGQGTYEPWASLNDKYIGNGVEYGSFTCIDGRGVSGRGIFDGFNGNDKKTRTHVDFHFDNVTQ
jgi:hypothetical protein